MNKRDAASKVAFLAIALPFLGLAWHVGQTVDESTPAPRPVVAQCVSGRHVWTCTVQP